MSRISFFLDFPRCFEFRNPKFGLRSSGCMAGFSYKALDADGNERTGTIDAVNLDVAIVAIQRRGLVISTIEDADKSAPKFGGRLEFLDPIKNTNLVIFF